MDLWIRSQDKSQIHKVYDVFIAKLPETETGEWGVFVNHTTFGYYKTKEQALRVLDEIQEMLQTRQYYDHCNVVNLIFEMPKE